MGSTYTNLTVRAPDARGVVASLAGRSAYAISDPRGVVVFDQACEQQGITELTRLAATLSKQHKCAVFAVLDHHEGFLWFELHDRGKLLAEYNSYPGFFDRTRGGDPSGGEARTLCKALGAEAHQWIVEQVLHGDGFVHASDRHRELVALLGLPEATIGRGFQHIARGDVPEDAVVLRTTAVAPPGVATTVEPKRPPQPIVRARPPLSDLVGAGPQPFTAVFAAVVQHVHGACGGFGPDGATIRCDDRLRAIFDTDTVHMREVAQRLLKLVDRVGEYQP